MVDRLIIGLIAMGMSAGRSARLAKTLAIKTLSILSGKVPADPVHARPASGRPDRHHDLQPAGERVQTRRALFSQISSWPTKSTAPPPRCRAPCSRPCRRTGDHRRQTFPSRALMVLATQNPIEQEGHTRCRKPRSTVSS